MLCLVNFSSCLSVHTWTDLSRKFHWKTTFTFLVHVQTHLKSHTAGSWTKPKSHLLCQDLNLSSACRHAYRYRFCFVTSQSSLCIIRPSSSHLYLLNNSLMNTAALSYPGIPLLKMVTSHLLFAKQHLCHHISKFLSMQFRHHSIFDVLQRQLLSNPSP